MSTFKIGQKVVCIIENNKSWAEAPEHKKITYGPERNIIYEIIGISTYRKKEYLELNGWENNHYISDNFRPIHYDKSAISELVNIKHIAETSDQPMTNPSPLKPMKELINN